MVFKKNLEKGLEEEYIRSFLKNVKDKLEMLIMKDSIL